MWVGYYSRCRVSSGTYAETRANPVVLSPCSRAQKSKGIVATSEPTLASHMNTTTSRIVHAGWVVMPLLPSRGVQVRAPLQVHADS
jgi:hypothetical protein